MKFLKDLGIVILAFATGVYFMLAAIQLFIKLLTWIFHIEI